MRVSVSFGPVIVDVDRFKRINDGYGHPAGDAVLRALAEQLRSMVRATDIACRFGGEEFVVVLPERSEEAATDRAERLRAAWEARVVTAGKHSITSTLWIGLSTYPNHADALGTLVKAADLALYPSKRTGRNRVLAYVPGLGSLGRPAPPPPASG